jgi:hypothetical protein
MIIKASIGYRGLITVASVLLMINSCAQVKINNDFKKLSESFKKIELPFLSSDSTAFGDWRKENLIDTNYVKQFGLLNRYKNDRFPFKNLNGYQCSHIGKLMSEGYLALIYKTFTTMAGRGNPEIVLVTFTNDGKKIDETAILWNDAIDPLYSQNVNLNLFCKDAIMINSLVKTNGVLNKEIVPKSITEKIWVYSIQKDGKITLALEKHRSLFKDSNPNIKDDF